MTTFARQPRSGQIRHLLQRAASQEQRSQQLYQRLLAATERSTPLAQACNAALNEDKHHFESINLCLGGSALIENLGATVANRQPEQSPKVLLAQLQDCETQSVEIYCQICTMALEFDYQIFDLSYRNMNNNLAHLDLVNDLINEHSLGS